jgi:L-fuconolactonase
MVETRSGIIDTHHHLWRYKAEEQPWMDAAYSKLRRDFEFEEYAQIAGRNGVRAAVAVQSRPLAEDNEYLAAATAASEIPHFIVGWFDLLSPGAGAVIARRAEAPAFVGARHFLSWEPDDSTFGDRVFKSNLRELGAAGLAFDLLVRSDQLVPAARLAGSLPELTFVLDHLGNPRIGGEDAGWQAGIAAIAECPNVYVKVSGLTDNTGGRPWGPLAFDPYFDRAVETVGLERLVFGSDWPVVAQNSSFEEWSGIVEGYLQRRAPMARDAVLYGNAIRAYGLDALPQR